GINNKIKVLKRQAYGYRNDEFFKLKLYALHDKRVRI
nr:transposase [Prevotella sp.]